MDNFLKKLRFIKFNDIFAIFLFIIAIIPAIILKNTTKKKIWLVCEDKNEARDNGYVFFKYLCENNENSDFTPIYAINKKSPDYAKVSKLGKCISYGTLIHWIYYLAAEYNISSQKGGKPNAAVCYFLEVYGLLKNKRIFLQHGIIISDLEWLYYKNTKMRLLICGARPEYEFIKKRFGYPEENLKYLGLPRFDNLHDIKINKKQILIMPSWREWLTRKTDAYYELNYDGIFEKSNYFKYWNELLNSKELAKFVEDNQLEVIFYPHRNMQPFLQSFKTNSNNIKIASWKEYDIQKLLKESAIMITDYSSVALDFAYMKKPIIYYLFDIEDFRKGQYAEGYFDYKNSGFGNFAIDCENVVNLLKDSYNKNFNITEKSEKVTNEFFTLHDKNNCKRIYEEIRKL